jgi:signal transduction histidine kinase
MAELTKVIAEATGAEGAIIWEATDAKADQPSLFPSVLTAWFEEDHSKLSFSQMPADPITLDVLQSRRVVTKSEPETRDASSALTRAVGSAVAAVPLTFLDQNEGVISLYGRRPLASDAHSILEELATLLPELCHTIRDRQTLVLLHESNNILSEADLESPDRPLEKDKLVVFLQLMCEHIAKAFQCVDVSVFLEDSLTAPGLFALVASSRPEIAGVKPQQVIRPFEGFTGWVLATRTSIAVPHLEQALAPSQRVRDQFPGFLWSRTAIESEPDAFGSTTPINVPGACLSTLMAVPIATGGKVWGVLRCRGAVGPPYRFTPRDLPPIDLVAAQIAQYWSNWLSRRDMEMENRSWRDLARGITSLNRLMYEQLRKPEPERSAVYREALSILHQVVPTIEASAIRQVRKREGARYLYFAEVAGDLWDSGSPEERELRRAREFPLSELPPTSAGAKVFQTSEQLTIEDVSNAPPFYSPTFPQGNWLVVTPIRVSDQVYGVLDVRGTPEALPLNVPQIAEIIGGQLGLYLYLERTIGNLRHAEQELKETLRSQAHAFEDLEHQLVSPLLAATVRIERLMHRGRFDSRTESTLRAIRGLCRKATVVAMSAGTFASLAKGEKPSPALESIGADDLIRIVIAAADDVQLLIDPRLNKDVHVDRESLRRLGRQLLRVDRSYLQQCLGNILDNAAKYCYKGTRVTVFGHSEEAYFSIAIQNQGIAMDPNVVAHSKERGWRGKEAKTATGEGSGLGLWIVDNLVQSMRGELLISPERDMTTVVLRFRIKSY